MNTPPNVMFLDRRIFTNRSTIGELYLDGSMECFILEPTCRKQSGVKLAISPGRFEIVMYDSPKLRRKVDLLKAQGKEVSALMDAARVPLLVGVPSHDYVEIHPGNEPGDTEDCLLPGKGHDTDWVSNSVAAWEQLVAKILVKLESGKFYIDIVGGGPNF